MEGEKKKKTCFKDLKGRQKVCLFCCFGFWVLGFFPPVLAVLRLNTSVGFSELSTLTSSWIFSAEFVLQKCSQDRSASTLIFKVVSIFEASWNDRILILFSSWTKTMKAVSFGKHDTRPRSLNQSHWSRLVELNLESSESKSVDLRNWTTACIFILLFYFVSFKGDSRGTRRN